MMRSLSEINGCCNGVAYTIKFQEGQDSALAEKSSDCDFGKILRVKKKMDLVIC